MALKQQNNIQAAFSMASMTDVIFLLLVFFMATSTFVFPTAMEINLPQGAEQTSVKPKTCVYVDSIGNIGASYDGNEVRQFQLDELGGYLVVAMQQDTTQTAVAVYADRAVHYGTVIDVLNVGAQNNIKMVLATRPSAPVPAAANTATEPLP